MPPITINPIIPDDDDDETPKRKAPRRSERGGGGSAPRRKDESTPDTVVVVRPEMTEEEIKAVQEELRLRYGMDKVQFEELTPSRAGAKDHKTGVTRK